MPARPYRPALPLKSFPTPLPALLGLPAALRGLQTGRSGHAMLGSARGCLRASVPRPGGDEHLMLGRGNSDFFPLVIDRQRDARCFFPFGTAWCSSNLAVSSGACVVEERLDS